MSETTGAAEHLKRNTIGGVVGNILEWYDFAVFGYFAPIIGSQFFPSEDRLASTISAFGVFAAGYLMRPLGGVVFGHIGDRMGRKKALQLSVAMMAFPTILLGLLPTHAQIGVAASVMLVLLRLIQGVSVGGELIGSISFITEIAPPERRGFFGSWTLFSAMGGVMLGSAVATLIHNTMDASTIHAWGWRIPFLAGFVVAGFGFWMRKGLAESPEFEKLKEEGDVGENPVAEAMRTSPARILQVVALVMIMGGAFYILFVWWPTYLTTIIKKPVPHALAVNTISMLTLMALTPMAGALSDKLGRKPIIIASFVGFIVASYPLFLWTDHGTFAGALAAQLIFALIMSGVQGTMPATLVEMFPTRTRFSGVGIGYNVSLALFGGTAPLIATWLISRTGDLAAPAYYLIAMAAISLTAALFIRTPGGGKLE